MSADAAARGRRDRAGPRLASVPAVDAPDAASEPPPSTERDALAELHELALLLRSQAGRIAELEDELVRARSSAEAARDFALRESIRRAEIQEALHAVHLTKLWRYTRIFRSVYRGLRVHVLRRG